MKLKSKDKNPKELGRVAVLMGGDSAERDVSLVTGNNVLQALQAVGVDAYGVDVQSDISNVLNHERPDRAFIALHGPGGEDGTIQGMLEMLQIPYSGSDVTSSALTMNKVLTKWVWNSNKVPTLQMIIDRPDQDTYSLAKTLPLPLCVKPITEGSSYGVSRVDDLADLEKAIKHAKKFPQGVMIEPWIVGRELTVGILGDYALPVIEIKPKKGFYDFEAKYEKGATEHICPADLPQALSDRIRQISLRAFHLTCCRDWGRIDLMLDQDNNIWLLEINTIPGMTHTSLVPKAAKAMGLSFEELVYEILFLSTLGRNGKAKTKS